MQRRPTSVRLLPEAEKAIAFLLKVTNAQTLSDAVNLSVIDTANRIETKKCKDLNGEVTFERRKRGVQ